MSGPQITRAELVNMTDDQIVRARSEGRLASLMAGRDPVEDNAAADDGKRQLGLDDIRSMSPAAIVAAHRAGRFDELKASHEGYGQAYGG